MCEYELKGTHTFRGVITHSCFRSVSIQDNWSYVPVIKELKENKLVSL